MPGDEAGIAGEVLGGREALDGAQLPVDDDGEEGPDGTGLVVHARALDEMPRSSKTENSE